MILTARQRVLTGQRINWRVGQLVAFVHGPGRKNIYRFRVISIGSDKKPSHLKLIMKMIKVYENGKRV